MVLIAVHGSASRSLPAERATAHLNIELEGDDRAEVVERTRALRAGLIETAEAFLASGAATRVGGSQLWARSERRYEGREEQHRTVELASARIDVRFRDLEALAGWLLEAGSTAGVTVERVEWTLAAATRSAVERELRLAAVRDAVARAEAYGAAIGATSVELRSVWEAGLRPALGGAAGGSLKWAAQASARSDGPGFALRPEDVELAVELSADFEAEPAAS